MTVASTGAAVGERPTVTTIRRAGHPKSHMNVMPVEDATAAMVARARRPRTGRREGVDTYHVVHHLRAGTWR